MSSVETELRSSMTTGGGGDVVSFGRNPFDFSRNGSVRFEVNRTDSAKRIYFAGLFGATVRAFLPKRGGIIPNTFHR